MEIFLTKKPKSPIIIEGFPGVGLIATITTEFLIKHLNAKPIGYIKSDELLPIAAVHNSRVLQPLEIFYVEKENLVIVHALSDIRGLEWKISGVILELYSMLKAKELITIEGIMSKENDQHNVYYIKSDEAKEKKLEKEKVNRLQEVIIVGVTAALFGWIDTVMGFVIATIGLVFMLMCVIAAVLYSVGTSTPTRGPAHYAYDAYQGLDPKNKEKVHRAAWKLAGFASKHGAKWLRSKGRHRTADIVEGFRFFV